MPCTNALTLLSLVRNCRGAAQAESTLLAFLVALVGVLGLAGLGVGFDHALTDAGRVHGATTAMVTSGQAAIEDLGRIGEVAAKGSELAREATKVAKATWDVDVALDARAAAKAAAEAAPPPQRKRFLPNTRFLLEVDLNTGVVPGLNMGVGFVRENDLAIGHNGAFGMMSASWLVGAVKRYKSFNPELNMAKGQFTKELGMFTFDDPVYGTKTYMELPVPLATWAPAGIIPGFGAAQHAGRPGLLMQLQFPFTFVPIVGETFARGINHIIPESMPFGGHLRKLGSVAAMRVGVTFAVYNPRLEPIVRFANAGARWLDPRIKRATAAIGKGFRWLFSPKAWKERLSALRLR